MLLQKLICESNVDKRIAVIAAGYKQFCKANRLTAYLSKVDIFTFGGRAPKERAGGWNKAAVSSNFMLYLEHFCNQHRELVLADEHLRVFAA